MPTGFNVETGSHLSQKLLSVAPVFLRIIRNTKHPLHTGQLCTLLHEQATYNGYFEGTTIRALVNYWRHQKIAIASTNEGYWLARSSKELEPTIRHLEERIASMQSVVAALKHVIFFDDVQLDFFTGDAA